MAITGVVLGVVLGGCGGQSSTQRSNKHSATAPEAAPSAMRELDPVAFAAAVRNPATVTINVHVPDQGSIRGTDLEIPFDKISARRAELPPRSTPLAVYCRTGRMSAIALRTLRRLGFASIAELAGGMRAWERSGRRLVPPG